MLSPGRLFIILLTGMLLLVAGGCENAPPPNKMQYMKKAEAEAIPSYHFAVHPLHNPTRLLEAYQPLMDWINQNTDDFKLVLEASRNYQFYEKKFAAGKPEILLPNPWHTLQAQKVGYKVIAMAGEREDFRGIFIARKDSPLQSPLELKGQSVSYPSHTALAACIMPQYFLHQNGIDVLHDIDNHFVGSQESSIMNVYLGKVAVAATWPPPWRIFQRDYPDAAAKLKVIWQTPHLLNNSVMVRNDLPASVAQTLQQLLLDLDKSEQGRAALKAMSTKAFYVADDQTYAEVQTYVDRFEREVRQVEDAQGSRGPLTGVDNAL